MIFRGQWNGNKEIVCMKYIWVSFLLFKSSFYVRYKTFAKLINQFSSHKHTQMQCSHSLHKRAQHDTLNTFKPMQQTLRDNWALEIKGKNKCTGYISKGLNIILRRKYQKYCMTAKFFSHYKFFIHKNNRKPLNPLFSCPDILPHSIF